MGAWIEITSINIADMFKKVAPHMGAWIEICSVRKEEKWQMSHPTWVRGLK